MRLDSVKGHLDLLLLGVLAERPAHGYLVIARIRQGTDGLLDLTEGAVYPALHRLEDRGLLASTWQPVAGRRRRLYEITAAGRRALRHERDEWEALSSAVAMVLRAAGGSAVAAQ